MQQVARQYRFHEILNALPRSEYRDTFNALCAALGISRNMMYRYINATWDAPVNMSPAQMVFAASVFKTDISNILNTPSHEIIK